MLSGRNKSRWISGDRDYGEIDFEKIEPGELEILTNEGFDRKLFGYL